MKTRYAAAAAFGAALVLALAGPAAADPANAPTVTVGDPGDCGTTTFSTAWPTDKGHVANTVLVVQAAGIQTVANVGETITVGPFTADTTIRWRSWGGGERDYDQPALIDLAALLAHLDAGGTELDEDPPGVAWHMVYVKGCPPPTPTPEPEPDPSPTPTQVPTESPAAPGQGGEADDDDKGLPVTGAPAGLMAGGAIALLALGGGVYLVARRRRVTFTA